MARADDVGRPQAPLQRSLERAGFAGARARGARPDLAHERQNRKSVGRRAPGHLAEHLAKLTCGLRRCSSTLRFIGTSRSTGVKSLVLTTRKSRTRCSDFRRRTRGCLARSTRGTSHAHAFGAPLNIGIRLVTNTPSTAIFAGAVATLLVSCGNSSVERPHGSGAVAGTSADSGGSGGLVGTAGHGGVTGTSGTSSNVNMTAGMAGSGTPGTGGASSGGNTGA